MKLSAVEREKDGEKQTLKSSTDGRKPGTVDFEQSVRVTALGA